MSTRKQQGKRGHSAQYSLQPNQVKAVMDACSSLEERVTVGTMLYLGLRTGEVGHMKQGWITHEEKLRVPMNQTCNCASCQKRGNTWKPKTRSSARELHIPEIIKPDILEYLNKNPNGMDLSRQAIYHRVKDILQRSNVKFKGTARGTGFSHALRSTYATMLALGGIDALSLCYAMGWSSIKVADAYIQAVKARKTSQERVSQILG